MVRKRCAAPDCGRFIAEAARWCSRHQEEHIDHGDGPVPVSEETEAAAEFRRRLTEGDYRNLFGESMSEVIQQAAAEPGLSDEIGILRVVLARLLIEERDPAQLAASVSRVAGVAIQAARAQRTITGESAVGFTEALTKMLSEFNFDGVAKEGG